MRRARDGPLPDARSRGSGGVLVHADERIVRDDGERLVRLPQHKVGFQSEGVV